MTVNEKIRKAKLLSAAVLSVALIACSGETPETKSSRAADIVITNGKVKTPEGWAEALAIIDGRIAAVGSAGEIAERVGTSTSEIDLDGKVVLPGFNDSHVHPIYGGIMYSGANRSDCLIPQGSSVEQLQNSVATCVDRVAPGTWVTGGQWDASALGGIPDRFILDAVSADLPVLLNDTSGHSALANSRALELANVTANTADPEGGIIERDAEGNPTGVLRETAIGLVRIHVPPPSESILRESLEWSLEEMLSYGITSFTEASLGFVGGTLNEAKLYTTLAEEGVLKQRVRICMNWVAETWETDDSESTQLIENRKTYERDRLRYDCIKMFLDGVPTDSHTAAMVEPYADTVEGRDDDASRYGLLLIEQGTTNKAVTEFDRQGLTVKFHAAGDAAVRSGLDAIEAARDANGASGPFHNVGHNTFIHEDDVGRAKDIRAVFELSPYLFSPSPINDDITAAIGPERIVRVWPFRDAIDAGALVVVGSDWSVVPSVNPWVAVETMVTREVPGGSERSYGKGQAIAVEEAIELFTSNAAIHDGRGDQLGKISVGMLADLVVIDRNPYATPPTELHETRVLMTFIEGEMVYAAETTVGSAN